jgi:membrane protease YdiL (CAAX protease family)
MTAVSNLVRRHHVAVYFALTMLISWGGVLLVIGGPGAIPAVDAQMSASLLPWIVLSLVFGPFVTGIGLTGLLYGRPGLRDFLARLLRWRVGVRWYAVALLTTPLIMLASQLTLSLISPHYLPGIFTAADKSTILISGLMAGLSGGLFEEPGWTGFATPEMRRRYSIVGSGVLIGLMWGLWHFIVAAYASGTAARTISPFLFLVQAIFYIGVLPAYRVLMTWVYEHTKSLLIAMLMHGSLTAFTIFIFAPSVTDAERLIHHSALAIAMWIVVGVVALMNRGQLVVRPLQNRAA